MTEPTITPYFSHTIQISTFHWRQLELDACARLVKERGLPEVVFYRHLASQLNASRPDGSTPVSAGQFQMYASLLTVFRYLIDGVANLEHPNLLLDALQRSGRDPFSPDVRTTLRAFTEFFPPAEPSSNNTFLFRAGDKQHHHIVLRELLLLRLAMENRSLDPFRELLDDRQFATATPLYPELMTLIETALQDEEELPGISSTLIAALRLPMLISPDSLAGQLDVVRRQWEPLLPPQLLEQVAIAFDILREEERERGFGGFGEAPLPPVMEFGRHSETGGSGHAGVHDGASVFGGYDYPEHEAFSADADWMPNVVLMAKMVYVWLDQLSRQHGYPITRLDQIPESELATLARRGFSGLWLIGVWERSPASQRIKELCGNPDAIASAYSLYDYEIAADLGGWEALANLRQRALQHGIRLASDMVPNHTGIYSRWVLQHPDWFVQTDYPPFPTYRFTGENLSHSDNAVIQVEDGYWTKTDASVVFRMIEHSTGRTRYIYHGNDGTTIPWNDTAQLNYLLPEVREAVIQTILHVARNFPIIRFDAAMTLAKKHYQRLWFPIRGLGGGIPSRAEHGMTRDEFDALFPVEFWRDVVDRVAQEAPGTLLLAEAFWLMEGYFVRTLGMHRVYNSAFMNMLMKEENAKYRQTIKNVLAFNPEVLQRFVNFMNNPDEKTAVEQFGSEGKYFGSCLLLSTMPGLPMFGHGQIEGFREKYGMEYKRAYWDEPFDDGLIQGHEMWIFPILRKRAIFSGAGNFALYDFISENGVDENVYAYSNRCGEERALVLFHNRHAKTAGWIRQSSPIALTSGDNPELGTVSLAEALNIAPDNGLYYAFHDHTRGLEYLRSSQELSEQGLYAELGEYEFHIFSNFRELRDETGELLSWGALCRSLNGCGAENLQDELKQLRYARLNRSFSSFLELLDGVEQPADSNALTEAVQTFQTELAIITKNAKPSKKSTLHTPVAIATLSAGFSQQLTEYFGLPLSEAFSTTDGIRLLLASLLLNGEQPEILEQFGLDCTLRRSLTPDLTRRKIALVAALHPLNFERVTPKTPVPSRLTLLAQQLFEVAPCRKFMGVHTSETVEWFNKEAFEELLAWGGLMLLLQTKTGIAQGRAMKKDYQALCELARHAGYRAEVFLQLASSGIKTVPAAKPATKKTVSKTSAVKDKVPAGVAKNKAR